jgi:hypothetical protein
VIFPDREGLELSEDTGRGGGDNLPDPLPASRLQNPQCANDVDLGIGDWVIDGPLVTDRRSKMKYDFRPLDRIRHSGFVPHISFDEPNTGGRVEVAPKAGHQVVQHRNDVPALHQTTDQIGSDESGTASNQYFHYRTSLSK